MIEDFHGTTVTVEEPLCGRCGRRLVPWGRFSSTGELPPDPDTEGAVYRWRAGLWACADYRCRHPRPF